MKVAEIVSLLVAQTRPFASVAEAARQMKESHVGSLVVVEGLDDGLVPVGIVTDRDIVLGVVALDHDASTMRVADVMSRRPITIHGEASLSDALRIMRLQGIRRLPVTTQSGTLVGIVTLDDLLSSIADELGALVEAMRCERGREAREWPGPAFAPELETQ